VLDLDATLLPGGDIALAWTDTRTGKARIYYRARIGNAWTTAQAVPTPPGDARNPSLDADSHGIVHMAWLQHGGPAAQVNFMRFAYPSPWGTVYSVTDTTFPEPPEVVVRPSGGAYVIWADRNGTTPRVQFSRFHSDSGMNGPLPLTPFALGAQSEPRAVVSSDGTLHTVWRETNTGVHRLRYQRRTPEGFPNPPDEVLAVHGSTIENHSLAVDPEDGLHVAYQRQFDDLFRASYQRGLPQDGWDFLPTDLSTDLDGDATFPIPLPTSPGNVTVVYTGHAGGIPRLVTRERILDGSGPLVSVEPPLQPRGPGMRLQPNPIRAGQSILISWSQEASPQPGFLDIYDVNGRRISEVRLGADPGLRFTTVGAARTARWPAGIYFARLRGSAQTAGRFVVLR
jgi:hypothetical protein